MNVTEIGRCIVTAIPDVNGGTRWFILPYTGNLTAAKYEELGKRLFDKLNATRVECPVNVCLTDLHTRAWLRSESVSSRERSVKIVDHGDGNASMTGRGWGKINHPAVQFVILM